MRGPRAIPEQTDVVVVGAGGAGLAAAVSAADNGAKVVVLEKLSRPGGTSGRAVGSVSFNSTSLQRAEGIDDSAREHYEDLAILAGPLVDRDNLDLREIYTREAPATFEWLRGLGVVFHGPLPEEPHRHPRMHNALPGARAYITRLLRAARKRGIVVVCDATVLELIHEGDSVSGVRYRQGDGQAARIDAGAIVLATGDYSSDPALKTLHMDERRAAVPGINPASTGDGHRMGTDIGGQIINGDLAYGPELRFVPPPRRMIAEYLPGWTIVGVVTRFCLRHMPERWFRAILMKLLTTNLAPSSALFDEGAVLVNNQGERFCDERDNPAIAVHEQPQHEAFIVFDERIYHLFDAWPHPVSTAPGVAYAYLSDYRRSRRDIFHTGRGPRELAAALGLPTLDPAVTEMGETRLYALGPLRSYISMTDGGLAVTSDHEVIDAEGNVIEGLFAAGSVGQGGLLLEGHGHHLGWAFISGRRVGERATRHARADKPRP